MNLIHVAYCKKRLRTIESTTKKDFELLKCLAIELTDFLEQVMFDGY